MYRVVKRIDFCYGHRLLDYDGKCRNLHGHNGRAELEIAGPGLDARGMLADFSDVKRVMKDWIDANLDHRMILRRDDPALARLSEIGESAYVMDENPTAEALAKLIFDKARELGLPVRSVRLWETSSSSAIYEPQG
jgi:6-pyruvoyltetrahydropterin/6-carboxytetrahydropterin synthase